MKRYNEILDTRDLNKRRAEMQDLADALEAAKTELAEVPFNLSADARASLRAVRDGAREAFGEDERKELAELDGLENEVPEGYDGNTLIPVDGWTDYCRDLCADIGDVPKNLPDYIVIDWDATAANLAADYSECEYQGETYYYRNC